MNSKNPIESNYSYEPLIPRLKSIELTEDWMLALDSPDRRDGVVYDYDLHLAVEIALATGRPLLLRGDPGSGKSSLAAFVARNLNWRYYEHTVAADTRAQDLLCSYDLVRRLADAQARAGQRDTAPLNDLDYVEPGVLWWVFNPESAEQRGFIEASIAERPRLRPPSSKAKDPHEEINLERRPDRAVVLIDELDKADPAVPNALLVPLGSNCPASAGNGEQRSAVKLTEGTHEKNTKALHSRREGRHPEAASGGQGVCLEALRRAGAAADGVLPLAERVL